MPMNFAKRPLSLLLALAASAVLLLTLLADNDSMTLHAQSADTPTPEPTAELDIHTGAEQLPPIEGKLNPPKYPNMDSNLNRIVEQVQTGQFTAQAAAANAPIHREESVAVTLYITEGYAQDVWDYLEQSGASPRNIGIDYIEAYVPVSLLPDASTQEGVISIRTIIPPQELQGTVVSDGVALHGVPAWHNAGYRGQGVKIGIIDSGFRGFRSLMGTELPSTVQGRCYADLGVYTSSLADCDNTDASEHGTAVTEAAFDIAPEATYYISSPGGSYGDIVTAVDWMIAEGVDVINMSLNMTWQGPGDGTTPYSNGTVRSVNAAVGSGIIWVNAAGNEAQATWFGNFTDTDGDGLHDFDGTDNCNNYALYDEGEIRLARFTREVELRIQLRWDDRWFGANTDLNLVLAKFNEGSGQFDVYDSSVSVQSGGTAHTPFEFIERTVPAGVYCIGIEHSSGSRPDWMQIQDFKGRLLQHHTMHHSIGNPAESRNLGLLAVGAAPAFETNTIEPYSSQGPTPDGRMKPDIVGVARGQSVSYSSAERPDGRWAGTSQSSPHVAGLAALVKQRFPDYTPEQIANYLKTHADPRGAVPNNTWGYGFARLPATDEATSTPGPTATAEPTPEPTPSPEPTPEPTPEPMPTPPADPCAENLEADSTIQGSWSDDCPSESRSGSYASYYTFSLTESAEVTITLVSSVDPYLYLREGIGRDGTVLCENDDYALGVTSTLCSNIDSSLDTSTDSGMVASLAEGTYTIEATTYEVAATGDFTLTVEVDPSSVQPQPSPTPVPSPSPTPVPLPPDYNIEDHRVHTESFGLAKPAMPTTLRTSKGFLLSPQTGPIHTTVRDITVSSKHTSLNG